MRRWTLVTLVAVVALRWLGLGAVPLADPSEARYASIAQEMLRSGDWLTPRLPDGTPYLAKPPLYFWLTAASFGVFGPTELAARLPSALAELVLLAAVLALGRRFGDPRAGPLAALIAATSVLGLGYSALSLTDMTLAACVAVALAAFARAGVDAAYDPRRPLAGLAFFAALGLAMLAKGPVGVALPALTIALWSALQRDLSWARRLPWLSGALVFLALCAPWYGAAERATPGFLRYFLLNENLLRFLTVDYGDLYGGPHERTYGTAWWLGLVGLLPWSLLLAPLALALFAARTERPRATPLDRFVLAWALAAPLFFTLSRGVVLSYLLPSLPGFALALARASRALDADTLRRALFATGIATCLALAVAAWIASPRLAMNASDLATLALALPAAGLAALAFARRSRAALWLVTALLWASSDVAIRAALGDELESVASTAHLAREIEARDDLAGCEVVFFGRRPYSAWFYFAQPTGALREARTRLDGLLAGDRCHVLVFRDEDLEDLDASALPEGVCEHGRYRAFVARGGAERPKRLASDAPVAR